MGDARQPLSNDVGPNGKCWDSLVHDTDGDIGSNVRSAFGLDASLPVGEVYANNGRLAGYASGTTFIRYVDLAHHVLHSHNAFATEVAVLEELCGPGVRRAMAIDSEHLDVYVSDLQNLFVSGTVVHYREMQLTLPYWERIQLPLTALVALGTAITNDLRRSRGAA